MKKAILFGMSVMMVGNVLGMESFVAFHSSNMPNNLEEKRKAFDTKFPKLKRTGSFSSLDKFSNKTRFHKRRASGSGIELPELVQKTEDKQQTPQSEPTKTTSRFSFLDTLSTKEKIGYGVGALSAAVVLFELTNWLRTTPVKADLDALKGLIANENLTIEAFDKTAKTFSDRISEQHKVQLRQAVANNNLEEFKRIANEDVLPFLQEAHDKVSYSDRMKHGANHRLDQIMLLGVIIADKTKSLTSTIVEKSKAFGTTVSDKTKTAYAKSKKFLGFKTTEEQKA